jgi:hypothetical protein
MLTTVGENEMGKNMAPRVDKKKADIKPEKSELSERDIRLLLVVCTELVNFCANVTGKIDPAASAMLAYVRDDIRFESEVELP